MSRRNPRHSAEVLASSVGRTAIYSMEISGTHKFAASRQQVWDALHNPSVLQKSIPGVESIAWQGESAITASVHLGIGPISGSYGGTVQVAEHTAPGHLRLVINRNVIQADASVDLADDGAGSVATYSGSAKLSGPLSVLDNPIGKQAANGLLGQFFKNLDQNIG